MLRFSIAWEIAALRLRPHLTRTAPLLIIKSLLRAWILLRSRCWDFFRRPILCPLLGRSTLAISCVHQASSTTPTVTLLASTGRQIPTTASSCSTLSQVVFVTSPESLVGSPTAQPSHKMVGCLCKGSQQRSVGHERLALAFLMSFAWAGEETTHTVHKIPSG